MSWKTLLESVSESLHDHLQLRNDYLLAENRILRNQIDGRVQLTDSQRKELAEIGAKLGKKALTEIASIAQPDTILAWNRKFAGPQIDTCKPRKSVGRPRVDKEIEDWVIRMARENRAWGYDRIQGSLKHLGYTISDQTVGNILKRNGIPPAPLRKETVTWREFVRMHLDVLGATDFFNSNVWNWFRFLITCLFGFLVTDRRQVHCIAMTLHQHVQAFRPCMMRLLAVTAQIRSGLQLSQLYKSTSGHSAFEDVISDSQRVSFQDISKVIALPRIAPNQIRNGLGRHPPWLDQPWKKVDQEAA
jgi:transposase